MSKQFYTNSTLRIPLLLLLLGIVCKVQAQTLNISKSVANITTTGDGTTASQGDVLQYTIIVTNLSALNIYGKEVYAITQSFTTGYHSVSLSIPAGCRPGMYVLEVSGAKGRLLQQKLLKK
jgi:hypothetical protein